MKGRILGFTPSSGAGAIAGDNGERFSFVAAQWRSERPIAVGTSVDFDPVAGVAAEIYPVAGMALGTVDMGGLAASPAVQKIKGLLTGTLAFPLAILVILAFFMPAISSPVKSVSFMNVGQVSAMLNMGQSHKTELTSLKREAAGLDAREAELKTYLVKAAAQRTAGFDTSAAVAVYYIRDAKSQLERLVAQRETLERNISDKRSAAIMESVLVLRFLAPILAIFLLWRAWIGAPLRTPSLVAGAAAILAALLVSSYKSSIGIGGEEGSIGAMMDQQIQSVISIGFGVWLMIACGIGLVLAGLKKIANPLAERMA